jgi:hypothetical protein
MASVDPFEALMKRGPLGMSGEAGESGESGEKGEEAEGEAFEGLGIEQYKRWFRDAEEAHARARKLAHRDRDWYDNYDDGQWDPAEKATLQRRGQPLVTMNRIKRKVNFLCGIEQKSRSDPKAFPKKPQNEEQARVATDVLDFIETGTRFDKVASNAFRCMAIEGIEAVDVCYREGEGSYGIVPVEIDFDQFFYDPRSRRADFSDARFLGYHNWYDLEDALAMFPDNEEAEAALRGSLVGENTDDGYDDKPNQWWGDAKRQRVRVACMYYKQSDGTWNYVYFSGGGVIEEGESKYLDEDGKPDCPIIAASAYVTRENERYGAVRDMISPQMEMNYRRSMALFLMKNRRVWSSPGVFDGTQSVKEEIARADAHLIANGTFGQEWGFIDSNSEIAENFQLLQDAKAEIDAQGPNSGLQGRGVEQQSGRAILAQQNAGLAEENTLFDTHNDWKLRVYRAFWARAKQFWTQPIFLRVSDNESESGQRFTPVNQPQPMVQQNPMTGQPMPVMDPMTGQPQMQVQNALADMDVDIQIELAPDMLTLQHEQFEQLSQMAQAGTPIPPDIIIEASQLKDKRKLLERMKQDMDLNAKLQQQGEQMKQMQQMLQKLQRENMQLKLESGQESGPSPLDVAKFQADNQFRAREADRKDAETQAKVQNTNAQTFKTVTDAMTPPPVPNGGPR